MELMHPITEPAANGEPDRPRDLRVFVLGLRGVVGVAGGIETHARMLYPLLARLADRGWLDAQWETSAPAGRPPRHLYRLTAIGLRETRALEAARKTPGLVRRARLRPQREGT